MKSQRITKVTRIGDLLRMFLHGKDGTNRHFISINQSKNMYVYKRSKEHHSKMTMVMAKFDWGNVWPFNSLKLRNKA